MKRKPRVLAFVMAGGEGTRLHDLTAHRCKPAVPFNGKHRIVDFVLSNLINSEIYSVYLLVQYKSQALIEHVRESWTLARFIPDHFVTVVPPQMRHGPEWFQGTADAVYQNLHLIETQQPDVIAVFGADHIYRMDVRPMIHAHLERQADVSVATISLPVSQSSSFGIVHADDQMRISRFEEKPATTRSMPGRPGYAMASMGNYIFSRDVLCEELQRARDQDESDFGKHLLPRMAMTRRLFAYDFSTNEVPGVADFEEHAYWRDVGTIDAYFESHLDTLGARPRFRMTNAKWPIYASPDQAESAQIERGVINRSVVGSGCVVNGAMLDHAMLRRSVTVEEDASLDHAIVMERSVVSRAAKLRNVIVDQDNIIPPGEVIGYDLASDRERFHVSEKGIVVVPRAYFGPRGRG